MAKRSKTGIITTARARSIQDWVNICNDNAQRERPGVPMAKGAIEFENMEDGTAEISIFGPITPYAWTEYGEMDSTTFKDRLDALNGADVRVLINSNGGSVHEGVTIYNLLKMHAGKVTTHCMGTAGSISSLIFMAGEERTIGEASNVFVHNALTFMYGNAAEFRSMADDLEKISGQILDVYKRRTKASAEDLKKWMDAETIFTGAEAVEHGFAHSLFEDEEEEQNEPSPPPSPPAPMEAFKPDLAALDRAEILMSK